MARRPHEPNAPRKGFRHAKWHDWLVCKSCGAVVEDWPLHQPCPRQELGELWDRLDLGNHDGAGYGIEEAAARARAEGRAVAEFAMWRGGLREVAAMVAADWSAVRRLVARRRTAATLERVAPAAALEEQRLAVDEARRQVWDRMGPLINRTTGGT